MTVMTTIKVSAETRERLKKFADAEQSTMEAALAKVLDEAEEARFWRGVKDDYAWLQDDPERWAGYANELAEWDRTISDGLDDLK
jgi:predicted transcriptional regulator